MTLRVPHLPFALDPLIAEAKRRARQRRFLAAFAALILVGLSAGLALGLRSSGGGTNGGLAGTGSVGALTIPKGTDGIAVILYGRLFVTTKSGFHVRGLPVTAASLSPRARYVAAGVGNSVVELAPNGRRIWSRSAGVPNCPAIDKACDVVRSVAWSPDGSRIAYVVLTPTRNDVLHVIWRNGTHDTLIARNARSGQLSWRADSRAFAYLGAGTRLGADTSPIIYDLARKSRHVIRWPLARSPVTHFAFAPHGNELAIGAYETGALLVGGRDRVVWRGQTHEVGWLGGRLAVTARVGIAAYHSHDVTKLYSVTHSGATLRRTTRLPAPILAFHGGTVALWAGNSVLAGPIGSLHRVLRFTLKPCDNSGFTSSCQLPMGEQDISIG